MRKIGSSHPTMRMRQEFGCERRHHFNVVQRQDVGECESVGRGIRHVVAQSPRKLHCT